MKLFLKILVIAALFGGLLSLILMVGVMGALHSMHDPTVMETKPWQPVARLGLSFVLMTITIVLGGALLRVSFKEHWGVIRCAPSSRMIPRLHPTDSRP